MFEELKSKHEGITKEFLINTLKNAADIDPNKQNGCYELIQTIVNYYSQLSEHQLEKIDYNDLNLLYFITVGDWKYNYNRKTELVDKAHLYNYIPNIKEKFSEVSKKIEAKYFNEKSVGMVGSGFMTFKGKVSDEDCTKFIKCCIKISQSNNEKEQFDCAEETLKNGITGAGAASCSIILHCLKPYLFPIINDASKYLFTLLGLNLKQYNNERYYIENCKKIKGFLETNNILRKNYRILDLLSVNINKNSFSDIEKFKKLLEFFVYQQKINGNVYEGIHHSGQGYKGQNIRNLYKDYREYDGFTLDVSLQSGQGLGKSNNYIHLTDSRVNIVAEYKWLDKTKCDVLGLKIAIKSDTDKQAPERVYSIDELGLFDNQEPNEQLKLFFENFKNKVFEFLNKKNVTPTIIHQGDSTNMEDTVFPKNIILYGPPGTGKTYNSIIRAVEIIGGKTFSEEEKENFEAIKKDYDDYVKEGKVAFTTFHQSYGYEEFIEGIKPVIDDENDGGEIKYKVQDGIFKEFCLKAEKPVAKKIDLKSFGINENPTFWKVSLNGTGDNEIRKDCLNNGYIRIGFDSYGKNVTDESDFTKEGGRNVLNAFISGMKNGDIVLSCFSNTSIDAIGVVEGDYEWREDFSEYKRVRKVKWLVKEKIQGVDKHNDNKALTLGTVYKLNDIDKDWIYGLIEQEKSKNENVEKEESKDDRRVFIIDEINRGNISKIFGELITLIEDTKRIGQQEEMKAILPYSKKEFGVPDNVYIIGTMNTADRSIALMDTALRRRFAFEEMPPKPELLNADIEGINVKTVLETINKRIEFLYDREHTIGHSFFMKLKDGATIGNLADIFKNKIIPLLQEYFYDDYEKIRLVLGDNQKEDEECQFIKRVSENFDKLFGESELKDSLEDKTTVYEINSAAFYKKESYNCLCGQPKNDENETMTEAAVTTNENENE